MLRQPLLAFLKKIPVKITKTKSNLLVFTIYIFIENLSSFLDKKINKTGVI